MPSAHEAAMEAMAAALWSVEVKAPRTAELVFLSRKDASRLAGLALAALVESEEVRAALEAAGERATMGYMEDYTPADFVDAILAALTPQGADQ